MTGDRALAGLTTLLADDPTIVAATGGPGHTVAVPEPARAIFTATLASATARRPVVLAVPTGAEAERIAGDLRAVPRRRRGRAVPGVGDAAVRTGVARDRDDGPPPARHVAAARRRRPPARGRRRARSARSCSGSVRTSRTSSRSSSRPARSSTATSSSSGSSRWATGASTRSRRAASSRCAARSSTSTRRPPTIPVRIDLWGDEVDRLSQFSVADQRSHGDLADAWLFPVRELLADRRRARPRRRAAARPSRGAASSGNDSPRARPSTAWSRGCRGSPPRSTCSPISCPASALVAIVEPRRLRDRAQELLDEEAALAYDARDDVGRGRSRTTRRASRCRSSGCSRTPRRGTVLAARRARQPRHAGARGERVRSGRRRRRRARRAHQRLARRTASACSSRPKARGSKTRIEQILAEVGAPGRRRGRAARPRRGAARRAPRARSPKPISPVAGACTARRAARARGQDYYEGLTAGDFVVHRVHGIGRYLGMETREMFGITRDRLVVEFKGGDRVYVDSEDIGLIRKYTGGEEPKLSKMGGADWEKTRAQRAPAVRDIAAELVILYRKRLATPGPRVRARRPVPAADRGRVPLRGDARPAQGDRGDQGRHGTADPDGPARSAATSATARPRSRCAPRPRRCSTARRSRCSCPTTLLASQHGQTFRERFANYPVRVEVLSRFLTAKEQNEVVAGRAGRHASTSSSARTGCSPTTSSSRTSGCSSSTRSSASACSTRNASRRCAPTSTSSRSRATPIPRTLEMSLTGIRDLSLVQTPPEDRQPILTYVGEYDARAASEAIRRELLREGQVLFVHNRVRDIAARRRRRARARARRARRGRARPDGRGPAREGRAASSGSASTTCSCARRSSRAASTCRR